MLAALSEHMEISPRIKLLAAFIVVTLYSFFMAYQCWPAQIGCQNPSSAGWQSYINVVISIQAGPFAPFYIVATSRPDEFIKFISGSWFVYICVFIAMLPWAFFYKYKSNWSIITGTILWLFFGYLFAIGVFT